MLCGSPVRHKRLMPLNEIRGASSASNSPGSTYISLPWLTSPDPQQLRTTSGTTCEIEVVPSARGRLRSALARVHGELLARLGPKCLAARMFDGDSRALSE